MIAVVLIMIMGIIAGFLLRGSSRAVRINDRLTMWAIYLLLFLLGVAIGANELIMKNLPVLGLKALGVSSATVAGSVLLAWAGYHLLFKQKTKQDEG